jgi:iron-sulfur cluster repair protein YtfE (RIC family)
MLHSIGRTGLRTVGPAPVDLLRECHHRIRTVLAVAARLALATDAPPADVTEAANRALRYFVLAMPLHEEDEERSVTPRLLQAGATIELEATLTKMAGEHRATHEILSSLEDTWERIARQPALLAAVARRLDEQTASLRRLLDGHLAMEERIVFPALDLLPADAQSEIRAEMVARRTKRP